MKRAYIILVLIASLVILSSCTVNKKVVEASMVSRHEESYLLAVGKTNIPQKQMVVTVNCNGKLFDVNSEKLYNSFKKGEKVMVALGNGTSSIEGNVNLAFLK